MRKSLLIIAVLSVIIASCKKEPDEKPDTDTTVAQDNAMAEGMFNDMKTIADQASSGYMVYHRDSEDTLVFGCATVIRDTTTSPKTLTVDFGTSNCLCNDGNYRRGIIEVSYSGGYLDSGTVVTQTPNGYFVNDNQLTGTKTVTNMGRNSSGNLWWAISVNGSVIKANNGGTVTWVSSREREWVAGEGTITWLDDVYLITGSANGTRPNGESFNAVINTALRKEIGCRHFVSGVFTLTPGTRPARVFDYGSGACDNQASVTINGNTYNIVLH